MRAQVAHSGDGRPGNGVAADRHVHDAGLSRARDPDGSGPEARIGGEPAFETDEIAAHGCVTTDRDRVHRLGFWAGNVRCRARYPCFDGRLSGSVLTPLAPMCRPKIGVASASIAPALTAR